MGDAAFLNGLLGKMSDFFHFSLIFLFASHRN